MCGKCIAFPLESKIKWKYDTVDIQVLVRKELLRDPKPLLKPLNHVTSGPVFSSLSSRRG